MSPHLKWPSRILFGASLLAVAYLLGRWQTAHEKSEHQSSPEIVAKSSSQLLDKLKMVNELHTAMGIVQTIVTSSQDSKIFGMSVGSTKLLYVAVGQVRAGIDLAKLNPSAITVRIIISISRYRHRRFLTPNSIWKTPTCTTSVSPWYSLPMALPSKVMRKNVPWNPLQRRR